MTPVEALALAVQYHQQGVFPQAEQLYKQVLEIDPNNAHALHLLGVIALQNRQPEKALSLIQRAIAITPGNANFHLNIGLTYRALGRVDDAVASYQEALRLDPNTVGALSNLGNLLREQNRFADAEAKYRQALRIEPGFINAHNNLGAVLMDMGRATEAASCFEEALRLRPGYAQAQTNLGNALAEQGKLDEALACQRDTLRLEPNFADVHVNLGSVLQQQGELDEAVACFRQALQLDPNAAPAHASLGSALAAKGEVAEAISCYQRALNLDPNLAAAYHGLGAALRDAGDVEGAIASQREALRLRPNFAAAHAHLGHALGDRLQLDEALASYAESQRLKPNKALRIHSAMLVPPIYRSMDDLNSWRRRLSDEVQRLHNDRITLDLTHQATTPAFFLGYHGVDDKDLQCRIAKLYTAPNSAIRRKSAGTNGKIRVGFISRYFRNHTVGWLMRGAIANLSREHFEVSVLSVGSHSDVAAQWIRQHADNFVELPLSVTEARRRIAQQQLDVLFYTDIGMDPITYSLAFSRLAPVQCVTWGHPVTTGIDTIDYFVSSEELESAGSEQQYSEKLVRLKHLAIFYYRPIPPSAMQERGFFGLPETGTLYGCPQSLFKLHPEFDALLGDILQRDPRGTLVLIRGKQQSWEQVLRERFAKTLPEVLDRIAFMPPQDYQRFLNLNALFDVLLDPIHFGGGNTSYEGLALGVPIVTLPSKMLRGRITKALYHQMGMMDCVVDNSEQYVEQAVRLGTDSDYRQSMRSKILEANSVLYENSAGVRELEQFLQKAVQGETVS